MNLGPEIINKLPIRIYFEDTDVGQVVYYANYLRYLERGRTEWLRDLGFDQSKLAAREGIGFVVRSLEINYRVPARLDDELLVFTKAKHIGGASVTFSQKLSFRGTGCLSADAQVEVACVNLESHKISRIPLSLLEKLKKTV